LDKVPVLTLDDASEISADLMADEVFTDERESWACFRSILLEGMAHEALLIESVKRDIRSDSEVRGAEEVISGLVNSAEVLADRSELVDVLDGLTLSPRLSFPSSS
jgi:hypothetical protein